MRQAISRTGAKKKAVFLTMNKPGRMPQQCNDSLNLKCVSIRPFFILCTATDSLQFFGVTSKLLFAIVVVLARDFVAMHCWLRLKKYICYSAVASQCKYFITSCFTKCNWLQYILFVFLNVAFIELKELKNKWRKFLWRK